MARNAVSLRLLAEICPGDINGFIFPSGGGEANEAAIRMARLYTGSLGQEASKCLISPPLPPCSHATSPPKDTFLNASCCRTPFKRLSGSRRSSPNTGPTCLSSSKLVAGRSYHGGSTSSLGATGDFRRRFAESTTHGFVKFFNPQPGGFSWGSTDEAATQRTLQCLEEWKGIQKFV